MNLKLPIGGGRSGKAERAMSVGELIKALQKFDPKMAVTYHNGWVVGVKKTKGQSQIVCECYPNCAPKCATETAKEEEQVQIKLLC